MNKIIVAIAILFLQLSSFEIYAQIVVKGNVIDQLTKEPLELAVVANTKKSNTLTDRNGNFVLRNVSSKDSITITYIGYISQKIGPGTAGKPIKIQLEKGSVDLQDIIISGKSNSIITSRILSSIDLNMKPARSAQDLLRLVPGLFTAQQVGGGKAEQIFLRGFDADHGTDVNVSADGMPVNLVSHAHGHGWADLHYIIPETVGSYDFGKGPYYASKGDFTTAGYVAYNTINVLDKSMVKLEGGQFNSGRAVAMINLLSKKAKEKGQSAYIAGEALYTDGPFDYGQNFQRFNLFGKFNTQVGQNNKLSVILSTFTSKWRASGEIPNRAIAEGYIKDRFGVIDSGQSGNVRRTNAIVKLTTSLGNNYTMENQVYYSSYYFNLFTNFTFYLVDPVKGDEFNQHEERDLYGYNGKISHQNIYGNSVLTSTAGVGVRYDQTHPSWLAHSLDHSVLNYLQLGNIKETNINGYVDETFETRKWLFNAGVRFDYFNFYYLSTAPATDSAAAIYIGRNPTQQKSIISPKLNIQYTINPHFQLYFKTGKGFHSNDARVVIAGQGFKTLPAAYGADLGFNWKPAPRLYINTALWYIYLQQEFTYGSDYGDESVSPGGRTVRKGIDFAARYQINKWLYGDLNLDFARPRSVDDPKGQDYLPTAPTFTSTAGLYLRFKNGFNGGMSYRYLHDRSANGDYSLTAKGYFLTDLTANYTKKKYEVGISIENLLDVKWYESQIEYESRLKYETASVDEVSYTAGVPFFAKLKLSVFF
ncbi:MAG: TonB-dependent receptor [Bacteroidota bacterium]|nr:TonB-dependent receptor [Bacteroidota bacterium]